MYRVAVCEDEPALLADLCAHCQQILTKLKTQCHVEPFTSADALWTALDTGAAFDLLCLDILMPGITGMELALRLRERDEETSIVFITSSSEHLLQGYEVQPIGYLMKPLDPDALEKVLQTDLRLHHRPQTVTLRAGGHTAVLPISSIFYVESRDHGCFVHTDSGDPFFWLNLAQAEQLMPADRFCRCHNSFLVNMERIQEAGSKELLMADGSRVPIGRRYSEQFQRCFVRFLNSKKQ